MRWWRKKGEVWLAIGVAKDDAGSRHWIEVIGGYRTEEDAIRAASAWVSMKGGSATTEEIYEWLYSHRDRIAVDGQYMVRVLKTGREK